MNEKKNYTIIAVIAIIVIVGVVGIIVSIRKPVTASVAGVKTAKQQMDVLPSNGHAIVTIPAKAKEVSPGVFYLGEAIDDGKKVEGYAIIDYTGRAKPGTQCGNGVCEKGENAKKCPGDCQGGRGSSSSCYEYLARGSKWKFVEPYMVDPTNNHGLSDSFVRANFSNNVRKWENAAGSEILGNEIPGIVDGADGSTPDGKNEVMFGEIPGTGAIAVAIIWGIFSGPQNQRILVEWDHVYDQVDFAWSGSGEPGKMDFENIATHELGHSVGMSDLYTGECVEETMYGYASGGETSKRDLHAGDVTGIRKLYR